MGKLLFMLAIGATVVAVTGTTRSGCCVRRRGRATPYSSEAVIRGRPPTRHLRVPRHVIACRSPFLRSFAPCPAT